MTRRLALRPVIQLQLYQHNATGAIRIPGESAAQLMPKDLRVSLVIPVRNEAATISDLLTSIHSQTLHTSEIVFVDGGSVDNTLQILRKAAQEEASLRLLEAQDATPGRGRNIGIEAASNEWIALTDAGIWLEPTWLERLVTEVERDPSVNLVFGAYEAQTGTFFQQCAAAAYVAPKQQRPGGPMRGPSIASCLLHRNVWRAVGGFPDLRAAEDLVFIERCQQAGRIAWAPEAVVRWQLQPTLKATFRRFALYSYHNVLAGRQRYWHYGVARKYFIVLLILILAAVYGRVWLFALGFGAVARVAKAIWNYDEQLRLAWLCNPARLLLVGAILAVIDLATFVGWGRALWHKRKNTWAFRQKPSGDRH
jgi:glycosyltransferase involved in cell wall biosynthesis